MTSEKEMIVVSETHWDREWYLPFQEYRAKLVILVDKLLKILEVDPKFTNFTFDGQTIVLEDYLEVKPGNEPLLRKYITENRISVGPWYVLPDEFLVSGEALVRNLMLGHKIGRSFGRVMRAGYIPDPFGHVAQLPQILQGFNINSVLFMRGMDDSFENLGLNLEFIWDSPGKVTFVLAIYLKYGYGSVQKLSSHKAGGIYKAALRSIKRVQRKMLNRSASTVLVLNNGSDHDEVQAFLPEVVENWNSSPEFAEFKLVQNDFEYYVDELSSQDLQLKRYEGEFRGARHHYLLSGVFSARMWIKQLNAECQMLLENWAEPTAAFAWLLGENYPRDYLWAGWKWLLRNHPHDSICGCSIDEVHRDMRTRFVWAKQIADEITKEAMYAVYNRVQLKPSPKRAIPFLVFNSLPWDRTDIAHIDVSVPGKSHDDLNFQFELIDSSNNVVAYQLKRILDLPRLRTSNSSCYRLSFLANDIPSCGFEVFRLIPKQVDLPEEQSIKSNQLENEFYLITVHEDGTFSITDKELQKTYQKLGIIEDCGDWGDEYDFSPPVNSDADLKITNENVKAEIAMYESGPAKKTIRIKYGLQIPISLSFDRTKRCEETKELPIITFITLYPNIKRIDLKIELNNQSKDHRIRIHNPTGLATEEVNVDGHFLVVDRKVKLPEGVNWHQPPSKTNHQQKFISVNDGKAGITICNRGLPEYEAIQEADGHVTIAITLLRCIGWLGLSYMLTREKEPAGPDFAVPEAQCLGNHTFHLSITTHDKDFLSAKSYKIAQQFNTPLKTFNPEVMRTVLRVPDHIFFKGLPLLLPPDYFGPKFLPEKVSFVKIEPEYLILSACKKAEEDSALILRIYNLAKNSCKGMIRLLKTIRKVTLMNLDEHDVQDNQVTDLEINGTQFTFQIIGNKIATFKILLQDDIK